MKIKIYSRKKNNNPMHESSSNVLIRERQLAQNNHSDGGVMRLVNLQVDYFFNDLRYVHSSYIPAIGQLFKLLFN